MRLDTPLPASIAVGGGTALFVCGTCFDASEELASLSLLVDGQEQPVSAFGMPRLDYFRALHPQLDPYATQHLKSDPDSPEDQGLNSYRSGFWGIARVTPPVSIDGCELMLRARLRSGRQCTEPLARIPLDEARMAPPTIAPDDGGGRPLVAICMATYDSPPGLLERQLQSIRDQTHGDWVCLISDDCSRPERFAALQATLAGDPRFVVSRSPRRLGFYLNFERALMMVPAQAQFVALADQDDYWYPRKLSVLLQEIGDAQLVYSDARIISRDGDLISPTYWGERVNNHSDLPSLLMANAVTGAAALFKAPLLDYVLPFPPAQFAHYHDHWIGLVALVCGGIAFVESPLYDYVQHGAAALGHAAATRTKSARERLAAVRDDPRTRVRVSRARYFADFARLLTVATILELRCADRMSAQQRRELDEFLSLELSWPALAKLGWRAARELSRPKPVTLGAEWALLQAVGWRRALALSARDRPTRRLRLDALPPPDLAPKPNRALPEEDAARTIAEKIAPLELSIADAAVRRVNILIPTIDLEHFFGGYIAKFNLAASLARMGVRVRIVTVDPVPALPRSWRQRVESYSGLSGLLDTVEVVFGRRAGPLEVSRHDAFIATTWWTAHIAHRAVQTLGSDGFVYLIQEYEPFTFPMGTYAALARESYRFPHYALFSTELLRGYFRAQRIGVYEDGIEAGDAASDAFENAITPVRAPTAEELAARTTRRLLFYARPEPHAARNMFELGVLALSRVLADGLFRSGWELRGIGALGAGRRVRLGGGASLQLLPRTAQSDYAGLLAQHDVGLALMLTPHPSLVPIEMASAGLITVTNTFENKTAASLAAISQNLIAGEPTIEGIAGALARAADGVERHEQRARGSRVSWCSDWHESFDRSLLSRLLAYLESRAAAA